MNKMLQDGEKRLSGKILTELTSMDTKAVQTELTACPNCVYAKDEKPCDRMKYTWGFPVCIDFTPQNANEQYLEHCDGCKQRNFGCELSDAIADGKLKVTQLSVEEGYLMCGIAYGDIPNSKRKEINDLFRTLLDE